MLFVPRSEKTCQLKNLNINSIFFSTFYITNTTGGFLGGSAGKNQPANARDTILTPGQEDPLEKEMAAHSCILAWRNPWTEEPGGLQSMGLQSQIQLCD